ncbi:hypothetical protein Godav_029126 [Gossypium davidsonii]|uniref:Uncharacterized protein n=1 Tax=Gossypium davidsonii TaxID=34287 RepID=A0A7J8TK00_GOSDV|nr:hypothetical protein [Gossypium davidsonii]
MEESSITRPPMPDNGRLITSLLMRAHDVLFLLAGNLLQLTIKLQKFLNLKLAFTFGEDFSNFKLVRKIIRSLLERFSVKAKCANNLKKKKKSSCAKWSDEDSSSNFETDVDQVNNYVTFTSSVISSSKVEIDDDPDGDDEEEFLKTYKTMLGKWEQAKEELLTKELDNLINTKKELVETNLMLEKFNTGSNKLNEIHVTGRRDSGRSGLGFFNKGKELMKSPTMFVKESTRGVASARN